MLSGKRLLIIEEQFLIALDIQRMAEDANAAGTAMARSFEEAEQQNPDFASFDLAIVTPPRHGTRDAEILLRLAAACPAVVVSTAAQNDLDGVALTGMHVIAKPFLEQAFLDTCNKALEQGGR